VQDFRIKGTAASSFCMFSNRENISENLLGVLGESAPDIPCFHEALAFSDREHAKLEAAGAFDSNPAPGDVARSRMFKVRRGKVRGYGKYLSAEDQAFAAVS